MRANRIAALFGSLVQAGRKSSGWTQKELALRAGLGEATIVRMESGSNCGLLDIIKVVGLVSPKSLPRIQEAIAFNPEDFASSPIEAMRLESRVKSTRRVRMKKVNGENNDRAS